MIKGIFILGMILVLNCGHCAVLPSPVLSLFFLFSILFFLSHQQRASMDSLAHSRELTLDKASLTPKVPAFFFSLVIYCLTRRLAA